MQRNLMASDAAAQLERESPARSPARAPAVRLHDRSAVGVVSSLGYRNRRGGLEKVRALLETAPDVLHRVTRAPEEVAAAIDEFRERGLDTVMVNGGDGTLSLVLTLLLRAGGPVPRVAVLAGGRTNMGAGDIGLVGNQVGRLRGFLDDVRRGTPLKTVERPVMEVDIGPEAENVFGLFVGAGLIYRGSKKTWAYRSQSRLPGMTTGLGTATSVTRIVAGLLLGTSPVDPTRIEVRLDGEKVSGDDYLLLFATTLDRMALGMRPFWDDAKAPIHVTSIAHRNRHLFRACLEMARGRSDRFAIPENGHFSRNVHEIELRLREGITLDGEIVEPLGEHPIRIRADRSVKFVRT